MSDMVPVALGALAVFAVVIGADAGALSDVEAAVAGTVASVGFLIAVVVAATGRRT